MKILYFECFSGISGDMTLGALLSLGVPLDYLKNELSKLDLHGYEIEAKMVKKQGISATLADVVLKDHHHHHCDDGHDHDHSHEHRGYSDIRKIIEDSEITENAKVIALKIFLNLGMAEAKVHGASLEQIHFHEVGAVDSIVDIVGTAIMIDYLKPDKIYFSRLHEGKGQIKCAHGIMPVPVPATAELLSSHSVPFRIIDTEGEMITPTGAAIAVTLRDDFVEDISFNPKKIGYGAGQKDFSHANVLRVIMGETGKKHDETVYLLETNIDDATAELLGHVGEKFLEAGALDVFFTPIQMKKMRPGTMLSILCREEDFETIKKLIFSELPTIGFRYQKMNRCVMQREAVEIKTPLGMLTCKKCTYLGLVRIYPEYESLKKLAYDNKKPLIECRSAIEEFLKTT